MIRVCAAVVREGGKTLLCQRPEGDAHAGFWEFPGGKVAAGESDAECLRREIIEELGCKILPLDLILRSEHEYPGKSVSVGFYRAVSMGDATFAPREGQTVKWVETTELPRQKLLPADKEIAKFLADAGKQRNKTRVGGVI